MLPATDREVHIRPVNLAKRAADAYRKVGREDLARDADAMLTS